MKHFVINYPLLDYQKKILNFSKLYKGKKISKDQALCKLKEIKFETHTFEKISNK